MTRAALVTVAIPTHDRAEWLAVALDSARAQHYPALEIVVADDGNKSSTADAVARHVVDPRVRVLHGEASGVAMNHRRALEAARGDWIVFLADDDRLHPDFVSHRMRAIDADPGAAVVFSGYRRCDEHLRVLGHMDPSIPDDAPLDGEALVRAALRRDWSINSSLYRRDALLRAWPDAAIVGNAFDFAMHLRLAMQAGVRGAYGHWCDVDYRLHAAQTSRGEAEMRHFATTAAAYAYALGEPMSARTRALVKRDWASWHVQWARAHAFQGQPAEARRLLRRALTICPQHPAAWSQALLAHFAPWRIRRAG